MKQRINFAVAVASFALASCGEGFLDVRRDANQVVPSNVEDYQAILDNSSIMNETSLGLGMIGAGEFYVSDNGLQAISPANAWQLNAYLWVNDTFEGGEARDWNNPYERILYANLALDVDRVAPSYASRQALDAVKGQALFHRAWNYFQLAQTFCDYYREGVEQPGLPIPLDYDITATTKWHSLKETFDRIVQDLELAIVLLPNATAHQFQPSRTAAYAFLARVMLYLADYERAKEAAERALLERGELLDFNKLEASSRYTFSGYVYGNNNPEVIFHSHNTAPTIMSNTRMNVDSMLYRLYEANDLRKTMYFETEQDGRIHFKGSYRGSGAYFTGLATDELYLVMAECDARAGDLASSESYLNALLENRYAAGTFTGVDFSGMAAEKALAIVLDERRKELYMRGTRWGDLKRLNAEERFATSLERAFDGKRYALLPNGPNWSYPFPDNELRHIER